LVVIKDIAVAMFSRRTNFRCGLTENRCSVRATLHIEVP